jgi:competence protein ComEC
LQISYGKNTLLLTGDLEEEGMQELLRAGVELESQVFKVPHHGSRYSLESGFLTAVNPQLAVICVGKNNFGHPSSEVLAYYQQKKVPLFRTDYHGAITLECDGRRIKITPFKQFH